MLFSAGFTVFPETQTEFGSGSNGQYAFWDGADGGISDGDMTWGPRFAGQKIAPSLPREPYKAAAAVPFKTLILSIFSGDTSKRSDSTGTPSITINGVFPRKENEGA